MNLKKRAVEAKDIVYGDHEDFESFFGKEIIEDQDRWTTYMSKIVKQLSTGKHYRIHWMKGSTEYQETDMFPDDPVILEEVEWKEVTKMEWVNI
jgi:hypothetical protein